MSKKIYVGNLPYNATQESLQEAFSKACPVSSAVIITDKFSGRSKGFGFIEVDNDDDMNAAISMWNQQDFGGRKLVVNEARPLKPRD
ncbi:RNA-binding protein [Candidatus Peregrinibacteria bacterium]|nr:RNA-binding protein [Candidatus Peregrinibacteria bacterium]